MNNPRLARLASLCAQRALVAAAAVAVTFRTPRRGAPPTTAPKPPRDPDPRT